MRLVLAAIVVAASVAFGSVASASADTLSVSCGGTCDESGAWYTSAVPVTWTVNPAPTKVDGCLSTTYLTVNTVVSCHVWWGAGGSPPEQEISFPLNVEAMSPTVTTIPSRPPDSNGWYTRPVTVTFSGSSFSGIASCTQPVSYSGQSITGSCIDNAGKTASSSVSLNYDATPPTITGATASHAPEYHGWYTKPVSFTFAGTDSGSGLERCQVVRYSGPISGSVTGGCWDRAGNFATRTIPVAFLEVVGRMSNVRIASAPVLLRWRSIRHATYYNVQLYRGNRKVLSRWPSSSNLFLSRAWRFAGHRFRLKRGTYHWYVWPGYGSRAADRYGRSNMSGTFTVK